VESRTGFFLKHRGKRSKQLAVAWRPIMFGKQGFEDTAAVAAGWKWLTTSFAEVLRLSALERSQHQETVLREQIRAFATAAYLGSGLAARLDNAVTAVRGLLQQFTAEGSSAAWLNESHYVLEGAQEDQLTATLALTTHRRHGWSDWRREALSGGAKAMHRLTTPRKQWQPTVVAGPSGLTAEPQALLDAEIDKYEGYWQATSQAPRVEVPDRDSLPRFTAKELRRVASTFPATTGQSLEATHPRLWRHLSDEGLETFAAIVEAIESVGMFPEQIWYLLLPLIEKPKGGLRAILLCAGGVRVWQRARRPHILPFMDATRRAYWAFGAGKSPEDAVWTQAVRAEANVAARHSAAGFMWDGEKYYEYFDLDKAMHRARALGMNPVLVKVCNNFWRPPPPPPVWQVCHCPRPICQKRSPGRRYFQ
jgi:hypothetical protein